MVVAAGAEERRLLAQRGHHVEAEHVGVERVRRGDVGDLQVHVAHDRAGGQPVERLGLHAAHEIVDVERLRGESLRNVALPERARAVPVDLDAVPVGVAQVDRLADDVVGEAGERDAVCLLYTSPSPRD